MTSYWQEIICLLSLLEIILKILPSCTVGILPCAALIPGLFFIPESPRWLVRSWTWNCSLSSFYYFTTFLILFFVFQAKMGMMEECEASLQVLRGFDTDISLEMDEIKVISCTTVRTYTTWFTLQSSHASLQWYTPSVENVKVFLTCTFPSHFSNWGAYCRNLLHRQQREPLSVLHISREKDIGFLWW